MSIVQVTISVFACVRISGIWCCALSINLISSIFRWHILNYFLWLSVSLFVSLMMFICVSLQLPFFITFQLWLSLCVCARQSFPLRCPDGFSYPVCVCDSWLPALVSWPQQGLVMKHWTCSSTAGGETHNWIYWYNANYMTTHINKHTKSKPKI